MGPPSLTETSLCGAYLYFIMGHGFIHIISHLGPEHFRSPPLGPQPSSRVIWHYTNPCAQYGCKSGRTPVTADKAAPLSTIACLVQAPTFSLIKTFKPTQNTRKSNCWHPEAQTRNLNFAMEPIW